MKHLISLLLVCLTTPVAAFDLKQKRSHIIFSDEIRPTHYTVNKYGLLTAKVRYSASALIYAFDRPRKISEVSFVWKPEGFIKTMSYKQETTKKGDDFYLRIGLILSGPKPFIPFFAPAWVKAIRGALKLPSDKMIYLTAGAWAKPGTIWPSPYTDSMTNISVGSQDLKYNWRRSTYKPKKPLTVVGIWIMADGDNTGSKFTTKLKSLTLK